VPNILDQILNTCNSLKICDIGLFILHAYHVGHSPQCGVCCGKKTPLCIIRLRKLHYSNFMFKSLNYD
jgi:hypothetical protein